MLYIFISRIGTDSDTYSTFSKGLSSLKKKIGDAVIRAEMFAPTALEVEEARWSKQEEMIRDSNLWDDPAKSDRILVKLADVAKVVDSLKDLTFKVMYKCCFHRSLNKRNVLLCRDVHGVAIICWLGE